MEVGGLVGAVVDQHGNTAVCDQIAKFSRGFGGHKKKALQIIGSIKGHQAAIGLAILLGTQRCQILRVKQCYQGFSNLIACFHVCSSNDG